MIKEAGKSRIYRAGQQAGDPEKGQSCMSSQRPSGYRSRKEQQCSSCLKAFRECRPSRTSDPLGPGCTQPCTWRRVLHGRRVGWARRHHRPPCHWAVQPWTRTRFSESSPPRDLSIPGPADSSRGLQPSRQDQGGAESQQLGFLMPACHGGIGVVIVVVIMDEKMLHITNRQGN